ncbi:MAG: tRNA (adenosine(37)-N6)-threonylcarbamoyltransferase complex ATPase subunit type 1 TsaE [Candidatus Moranbacteria bacterium]|nr:tRNA (adenosine(37)-N6)-threonylcarbamoyltransferase complex ATPase subunit type 1 TsaE [Candidatus Moranbacteria bacterium]
MSIVNNQIEFKELALKIFTRNKKKRIFCLYGGLGAGKTTFTQAIAKALKIEGTVTSPTFNIIKQYKIQSSKIDYKNLYHIDCYRLEDEKEILNLGFRELVEDKASLLIIEWADKINKILPKKRIDVYIKILDNFKREIIVK